MALKRQPLMTKAELVKMDEELIYVLADIGNGHYTEEFSHRYVGVLKADGEEAYHVAGFDTIEELVQDYEDGFGDSSYSMWAVYDLQDQKELHFQEIHTIKISG